MSDTKQSGNEKLKITLTRSLIGRPEKHCRIARALGLGKRFNPVVHYDSPTIRGMVTKISHLLTVEGA